MDQGLSFMKFMIFWMLK